MKTYQKLVAIASGTDYRAATEVRKTPMDVPAPDEVLIRNRYAGVNASDVNLMSGKYFADAQPPFDLGFEFAGEVAAVGTEVSHLKVGDQVLGIKAGGGYREYVTLPAAQAIPVPALSAEVMSLLTVGLAASIGLKHVGEMGSGETVLVTAAAGGTGHIAVQLAKQTGNRVIGTCGSAAKAEMLRELGCDHVINYREQNVDAALAEACPEGIDLIFENVGGQMFDTALRHIAKKGRLLICGFVSEYLQEESVTGPRVYHQLLWKSASLRGFLYSDYPELIPTHLQELIGALSAGSLRVIIDPKEFRGVAAVPDAMEHLYERRNNGRVVVRL